MDRRLPRPVVALAGGLAAASATVFALLAGCADGPVAPLSGRQPAPSASAVATPSGSARPSASATSPAPPPPPSNRRPPRQPPPQPDPTPSATPSPTPDPDCLGAEVVTIDGSGDGEVPGSLCVAVGAVLRIQNVAADAVTAGPSDVVTVQYADGVAECRLSAAGDATVTITHADLSTDTISVRVIE